MRFWYQPPSLQSWLLSPLSGLYRIVVTIKRWAYDAGLLKRQHIGVPVIVVGNLTVGGNGKTPIVIELAKQLQHLGYKPGIVSRGYKGNAPSYPFLVQPNASSQHAGDEPVLIAQKTQLPVMVDPNRPRAAKTLFEQHQVDIIISDDGLQHYPLARDMNVVVEDSVRGYGNAFCLPAGPLREPLTWLQYADCILDGNQVELDRIYPLTSPNQSLKLEQFLSQPVHAIAGIGNPEKFFSTLEALGLTVIKHPFPDHHHFCPEDLNFGDQQPILMTEKDAVKCQSFALDQHFAVAIRAKLPHTFIDQVLTHLSDQTTTST